MKKPWNYKRGQLVFDNIPLSKISDKFKTPFYLYSEETLIENFNSFHRAAIEASLPDPLICFALKANPNSYLLSKLAKAGSGADIVSGGELKRALENGIHPQKVVFSGVGKTADEIEYGLKCHKEGIYSFNVESIDELKSIGKIAKKLGKKARVAFRLNPQVNAKTHRHISTGFKTHKFGLLKDDILAVIAQKSLWKYCSLVGLSTHIGSQLTCLEATKKAMNELANLANSYHKPLEFIDVGGGLGIDYAPTDKPANIEQYMNAISDSLMSLLNHAPSRIVFEPGRYIAARSGLFVTKVIRTKESEGHTFAIVDGGMNDFVRTSLYEAYHDLLPHKEANNKKMVSTDVVGPICETADCFGTGRMLPELKEGDILGVADVGAYGFSMASQYNLRSLPKEIIVTKRGSLKKTT